MLHGFAARQKKALILGRGHDLKSEGAAALFASLTSSLVVGLFALMNGHLEGFENPKRDLKAS
jgi:hypothetical protein